MDNWGFFLKNMRISGNTNEGNSSWLMRAIMKKRKPLWKMIRIPLPGRTGRPLSTRKGKKGYDRKRAKEEAKQEVERK